MNTSTHTIAALSTPPGRGALAVIRLTGDGAQDIFAGIIKGKDRFRKTPARTIGVYTIIDDLCDDNYDNIDADNAQKINVGSATYLSRRKPTCRPPCHIDTNNTPKIIDEVTAIKYDAPRSFTGEEMVEIFCHGGDVVPQKILNRLFRQGARAAGHGEFSRRAFVNGKIGLLKAESIAGLIESQTETRLQSAQLAYQGKQSESLEKLKRRIIAELSDVESRIEFGEDDDVVESGTGRISTNKYELESITTDLEEELRRGDRIRAFDDGIIVALAGPANAGKSSLFNEILGYDRSIVHDRPGTTRDIVSERIIFEGTTVKLIDSAGIRDTDDTVEQSGIERTRAATKGAHIVIWVTSADEALGESERSEILAIANLKDGENNIAITGANTDCSNIKEIGENIIVVINKIDIPVSKHISDEKRQFCEEHSLKCVETSLTEKINRENLFNAIGALIRSATDEIPVPQIIVNERHRGIVAAVIGDLQDCLTNFEQEEIAAHYLKSALGRLEEFSGHVAGDEVLDEIFGKFCIGK